MTTTHSTTRRRGARGPRRLVVLSAVALCAALVVPPDLFAWGAKGHRMVGSAAAAALPGDVPDFFRAAGDQLSYLNPEPDRWKAREERNFDTALDGAFNADHFLDTEMAPPALLAAAMKAPHRYAYADTLRSGGVDATDLGFLPFAILELTQRLRQEFRMWRSAKDSSTRRYIEARIINDAGILGHYVADASNPAHTTIHYNGWSGSNPNGYATDRNFHSRFETAYVQAHIELRDILPRVASSATVHQNLRDAIMTYIAQGNAQVERLYQLDKQEAWGPNTSSAEHKAFTAERLAASATMLRDLWYTAWMTSTGPYRDFGD